MFNGQSTKETPYAVHCPKHGKVYLTQGEYGRQLSKPDSGWTCPVMSADPEEFGLCGRYSDWDDNQYEKSMYPDEEAESGHHTL